MFGDDASGYLQPRKQGGLTVYTREAEAFVDVYPQAGGTRVDYAQSTTAWRCSAGQRQRPACKDLATLWRTETAGLHFCKVVLSASECGV